MANETPERTTPLTLVAPLDRGVLSGAAMKARMDLIYDVMKSVMEVDQDFGIVPGCRKPSLWQAGADKLCVAFRIAPKVRSIEDLSVADAARYRVIVEGVHQETGVVLAEGVGECSSDEERYRWRRTYIEAEFAETPEDRKRMKWREKRNAEPYRELQIRTSPPDVSNTVLKMAVKRAKVAMALAATGAAAIFTQDLEDLPPDVAAAVAGEESGGAGADRKEPQRASATKGKDPAPNGMAATPAASATKPEMPSELSPPTIIQGVNERKGHQGPIFYVSTPGQEYSCFERSVADQLQTFVGTDHRVVIRFTTKVKGEKTYRNVASFAVAEPSETPAPATAEPPTQDDIRWR